jgi:sialidase-1
VIIEEKRAIAITKRFGRNRTEHPSSRQALQEPVCMASLIHVDAKDNILNKDILLFSNPNTTKGRNHITHKSKSGQRTYLVAGTSINARRGRRMGYSCLTMIDKETIGILFESSVAHITFQAIKLTDIIKE